MSFVLHPDEKIIKIFHRYHLLYFWYYFFVFLFIVAPFFFMFVLFSWGNWGLVVFGSSIVTGLIILFRAMYFQHHNSLIITSERVINVEQRGILNQIVVGINYEDIQNISFQIKGFFPTIFRYGAVKFKTAEKEGEFVVRGLKKPALIVESVSRIKVVKYNNNSQTNKAPKSKITDILNSIEQFSHEDLASLKYAVDQAILNKK